MVPLGSTQRRCYEPLIVALRPGTEINEATTPPTFKSTRYISSVPGFHSQKPFVVELFRVLLPKQIRFLELFARNLLPHTTSWGTLSAAIL